MQQQEQDPTLIPQLKQLIQRSKTLLEEIQTYLKGAGKDVSGLLQFRKRVNSEKKFLERIMRTPEKVKIDHIKSTNMKYLESVFYTAKTSQSVSALFKAFPLGQSSEKSRISVDIVAQRGKCWIKLKTMQPASIQLINNGNGTAEKKSIHDQAVELIECAARNCVRYQPPMVCIKFINGVTEDVRDDLEALDIVVLGPIHDMDDPSLCIDEGIDIPPIVESDTDRVNLDVASLVHLCSALTNGDGMYKDYVDPMLSLYASEERENRSIPRMLKFMEGKDVICTEIAKEKFLNIVNTLGGPWEKQKAEDILKEIRVVPDDPSESSLKLEECSKIKDWHISIFGTGDKVKATTMTSNIGFIRAAKNQGVNFDVFLHKSRALSELAEVNNQ